VQTEGDELGLADGVPVRETAFVAEHRISVVAFTGNSLERHGGGLERPPQPRMAALRGGIRRGNRYPFGFWQSAVDRCLHDQFRYLRAFQVMCSR
jgi:hypothetical protein